MNKNSNLSDTKLISWAVNLKIKIASNGHQLRLSTDQITEMIHLFDAIINSVGNYIFTKTARNNAFCNKLKVLSTAIASVNNYTSLIINSKNYIEALETEMGSSGATAIFNSKN